MSIPSVHLYAILDDSNMILDTHSVGIGMAQLVSTFFLTVFYNYIMAICLFYLFASMQSALPWTFCDSEWADNATCFTRESNLVSTIPYKLTFKIV